MTLQLVYKSKKVSFFFCWAVFEILSIFNCVRLCAHAIWCLTVGADEASEGSRDRSEWPGHYSATTNNSPQDKESFVTEAALTNSMHCVIKLAATLLPLCYTVRTESPQGMPVGESPLFDTFMDADRKGFQSSRCFATLYCSINLCGFGLA